jgi:hypothetical protein
MWELENGTIGWIKMKNVNIKFQLGRSEKTKNGFIHKEYEEDYKNSYFPGRILLNIGDNDVTGDKYSGQGYFGDYPLVEFMAWLGIMSICEGETLKCWRTDGPDFILFELIEKNKVMVINYSGGQNGKILNSDIVDIKKLVPEIIKAGDFLISHISEKNPQINEDKDIQRFTDLMDKLKKEWQEYQKQIY